MAVFDGITASVDTGKTLLSGDSVIFKTEKFLKLTRGFFEVDKFLSKISESIIKYYDKLVEIIGNKVSENGKTECYLLQTTDKIHSFYFKFGWQINCDKVGKRDIVFFQYADSELQKNTNDPRLNVYLKRQNFEIFIDKARYAVADADFNKLYRLSNNDRVNFPLLSLEQKQLVETEDKNVIAQGVAGSGKTNVCIDKIVYSACRFYKGKILYSTYSRGLLIETKKRVNAFIENCENFLDDYAKGNIVFADKNHKQAVENKLGVYLAFNDDKTLIDSLKKVVDYLKSSVDYFLLEDLYFQITGQKKEVVGENFFIKNFVNGIKNHQLTGRLNKVKHLSLEVIFKEIYGLIYGSFDIDKPKEMLTLDEYTFIRKDSFNRIECETIYALAKDYGMTLRQNKLTDNNFISRELLKKSDDIRKYSLAILDETQDMTEVNLCLIKSISLKCFCVGDALQMINPSYFGFAYLKRLLYEKDTVSVAELKNNYRNTAKIADIIDDLGQLNVKQFGVHSFVLKGESVESDISTSTVYVKGNSFIDGVAEKNFDNVTVIVSSAKVKEELRNKLKSQEILTVSEIKGLERDTVVLYNVLSDNKDKWAQLQRMLINRKQADENSVFRYYFNLFYVGLSRARQHIYVNENDTIPMFGEFFDKNFSIKTVETALSSMESIVGKIEVEKDELLERIRQFIALEQYDNARFATAKLSDAVLRAEQNNVIDVSENYVQHGQYREAGVRFWELGMQRYAKDYFLLSGDDELISLMEACNDTNTENKKINIDIVRFFPDMAGNTIAKEFILQTVKNDLSYMKERNKKINNALKHMGKEKKNG